MSSIGWVCSGLLKAQSGGDLAIKVADLGSFRARGLVPEQDIA